MSTNQVLLGVALTLVLAVGEILGTIAQLAAVVAVAAVCDVGWMAPRGLTAPPLARRLSVTG